MIDIFLSYKREDQRQARWLADVLADQGWEVWWDPELRAGERFDERIRRAIAEARCVLVLWSRRSVGSQYVLDEAGYAAEEGKLLPVDIESVQHPFGFGRIHAAKLYPWDGSLEAPLLRRLIADVANFLGEAAPPAAPSRPDAQYLVRLGAEVEARKYESRPAPEWLSFLAKKQTLGGLVPRVIAVVTLFGSHPSAQEAQEAFDRFEQWAKGELGNSGMATLVFVCENPGAGLVEAILGFGRGLLGHGAVTPLVYDLGADQYWTWSGLGTAQVKKMRWA